MPAPSTYAAIRASPLFARLDETRLQALAEAAESVAVAGGALLFRQGDPSDAVYIVTDGCLEVVVQQGKGDVTVGTLGPGALCGEMQMLTGGRRTATVRAREATALIKVQRSALTFLLDQDLAFAQSWADLVRGRLRHNRLAALLPRLFGPLDDATLDDIEQHLAWVRVQRGEALLREGDLSKDVYVLLSGRLLAVRERESGPPTVVGEVRPGEIIGEMAFLAGEPRAASLYAVRDADLVCFSPSAFTHIVETYPQVMRAITLQLVERLRRRNQNRPPRRDPTNLAVVALSPGVDLDAFAQRLTDGLASFGATAVLHSAGIDQMLGTPGIAQATGTDPNRLRLLACLDDFEEHHERTLYVADADDTPWTARCLRQADLVLLVANSDADPSLAAIEQQAAFASLDHAALRRVLVLLHPDGRQQPVGTSRWLAPRDVERHVHVRWDTPADFGRLARLLTGNAVGLVLGGGGARAAAHIGVLQALTEQGVPIDLIGGTSAGGGVAAQHALGYDIDRMREMNWNAFVENNPARPYTLPITSLTASFRADALSRTLYGDAWIEDLWTEYFCTSSDLSAGVLRIHQRGPLWKAVRATTALPGIFAPVVVDGHLLVDGGLLDNLPFAAMQALGAGVLILVDVGAGEALTTPYSHEEMPTSWQVARSWLNPATPTLEVPKLLDILMRTVSISSLEKRQQARDAADLYLSPPVSGIGMLEFSAMRTLIQRGYEHTLESLASWPGLPEHSYSQR